jgi:hypothetical protein
MTALAHTGHLVIDLSLYGIPILALILALAVSTARSRRTRSRTRSLGRNHRSG